jgi:hypothetical protein
VMDITNLSSNWKKLQTTLERSKTANTANLPPQHALKRKREHVRSRYPAPAPRPGKKPRNYKSMAQDGTASKASGSIRDIEDLDKGIGPRGAKGPASENTNAGLSASLVTFTPFSFGLDLRCL